MNKADNSEKSDINYEQFYMLFFDAKSFINANLREGAEPVRLSKVLASVEEQMQESQRKQLNVAAIDSFFRSQSIWSTYEQQSAEEVRTGTMTVEPKSEGELERKSFEASEIARSTCKEINEGMSRRGTERRQEFDIESEEFKECAREFALSAKMGVADFISKGIVSADPIQQGKFFFQCRNSLEAKQVAEYLSNKENQEILMSYISQLNFWGLDIDMALRFEEL